MKIVCEKCDGKGSKMQIFQGAIAGMKCTNCKGKGYNQIEMTIEEVGRNGRTAQALEMALQHEGAILCISDTCAVDSIDELLEWADKEIGINDVNI